MTSDRAEAVEWRPVPGYEGLYAVSSDGQVYSLPRIDPNNHPVRGRVLKATPDSHGYPRVSLWRNGSPRNRRVHQLVCEAFLGSKPDGLEVRHLDDNKLNNHLTNLAYGTTSENVRDMVANRIHGNVIKTHCPAGHPLAGDNLIISRRGSGDTFRQCMTCTRASQRRYKQRQRELLAGGAA